MFASVRLNVDHSDIGPLFDCISEWERSRSNRGKNRHSRFEYLTYCIAKNCRSDLHRPDFVNHHQLLRTNCFMNCGNAHSFQLGKIKPVLSNALTRFEINIGKDSFFTAERDEFEPDAHTALADFLSVKTAGWQCQILHNPFDERSLSTSRTSGKQNSFSHTIKFECAL